MTADPPDSLSDYDYSLPAELIAQRPAATRDAARLMRVDRAQGRIEHLQMRDLPELLKPTDVLVLNDTRVLRARLLGRRARTGGRWEGLFLEVLADGHWRILCKTRGRMRPGEIIEIHSPHDPHGAAVASLVLVDRDDEGIWVARPREAGDAYELLDRVGTAPLPPYMQRDLADAQDVERYQTVYARQPGSVAAPTAGLHFTEELLQRCNARGIGREFVTLHVGIGTFRPISVTRLSEHRMHSEWCDVSPELAQRLRAVRQRGGRIVAVGTTSVRTLETAARETGEIAAWRGATNLFIRPGYAFKAANAILTNFHLPRSSLLVLVSAFADLELIREAYAQAIRERYRFYSYGDAMLIE
jgi:S-adenosylmethionine:tRNA ribosyltransferase-isomerase